MICESRGIGESKMNILFMSLIDFESLDERNIYTDLLRAFRDRGNNIYAVSPVERCSNKETRLLTSGDSVQILKLKIGNTQKTNLIEKGISTITLESKFIKGIKKYFGNIKFDLVLYPTPPITLQKAVEYVKKRDGAITYLLLKDIFPQNAVDLGMLSNRGWKRIILRYFRSKEKKLYSNSDYIGCMSEKNVAYVLQHNPEIARDKVEVCPNCIEPNGIDLEEREREEIRRKYGIPQDKFVFIYGGNLGKPQGIPFMIDCIERTSNLENIYWIIVGSGTEYCKLETGIKENQNVKLMRTLTKEEYERLVRACDCGMIFLDYRFSIPNFPSRLLSYMESKIPVLAITDSNSDVGDVVVDGRFGWKVESNNVDKVAEKMNEISKMNNLDQYGDNAYKYLLENYTAKKGYEIVMRHFLQPREKREIISDIKL